MTSRPLDLMHLVNLNSTNIGNGALTLGLERVMSEDVARPIRWRREAWDDYTFEKRRFDRDFVARVNGVDALVVGAAVTFNGRPYLANAGMRFDLPLELWPEIERPVIFYGVSHRHWPGRPFHHREKLDAALRHILDRRDALFSVRNDGTKAWLEELLGFADDRILVAPDPAVYVPAAEAPFPEIEPGRPNIVVALNGEDSDDRFAVGGQEPAAVRARIVAALAQSLSRIADEFDANLILAPHYLDDYQMIGEFCARCAPRIAHQNTVSTGLMRLKDTAYFYGRYACADLAISMRVHSMSPAIGLEVPTIAVVTQERMWAFLRDAGLDDLMLDAFAPDLADTLYAAAARALRDPAPFRERFRAAKREMRERSRAFHARVAAVLPA